MSINRITGCFSCKQPAEKINENRGFMKVKIFEPLCKKQSRFKSSQIFFVPIKDLHKNQHFDQLVAGQIIEVKSNKNGKKSMQCELLSKRIFSQKDIDQLKDFYSQTNNQTNENHLKDLVKNNSDKIHQSFPSPGAFGLLDIDIKKSIDQCCKNELDSNLMHMEHQQSLLPISSQKELKLEKNSMKSDETKKNHHEITISNKSCNEFKEVSMNPNKSGKRQSLNDAQVNIPNDSQSNIKKEKVPDYSELKFCEKEICSSKKLDKSKSKNLNQTSNLFRSDSIYEDKMNESKKIIINLLLSGLSFRFIENKYFRIFVHQLNPDFKIPEKNQLKTLYNDHHNETKDKVLNSLAPIEHFCVTSNVWTTQYQTKSYIGLTCHYLDVNMRSKSIKLGIFQLNFENNAENLAEFLRNKLNEYGIYERLYFMVVDNSILMRKCCQSLNSEFLGCINHLLHLIVNRFLNVHNRNRRKSSFHKLTNVAEPISEYKKEVSCNFDNEVYEDNIDDDYNDDEDHHQNDENDPLNELFEYKDTIRLDIFPQFKEYSGLELEILELMNGILKKMKCLVSAFNKYSYLNNQLLEKQKNFENPLTFNFKDQELETSINIAICHQIERYIQLKSQAEEVIREQAKSNNKKTIYHKYQKTFLTQSELDVVVVLRDMLKPFLFVAKTLKNHKFLKIDLVIHSILYIRYKISEFTHENEQHINQIKSLMLNSFNFYVEKFELLSNRLIISAALLSPKYRSFRFSLPSEKQNFIRIGKEFIMETLIKINRLHETDHSGSDKTLRSNLSFFTELHSDENGYNRHIKHVYSALENEFSHYMKDESRSDFVEYWQTKKLEYPLLFRVARVIFSCPATSSPNELVLMENSFANKSNCLTHQAFEKLLQIYGGLIL